MGQAGPESTGPLGSEEPKLGPLTPIPGRRVYGSWVSGYTARTQTEICRRAFVFPISPGIRCQLYGPVRVFKNDRFNHHKPAT